MKEMIKKYKGTLICSVLVMLAAFLEKALLLWFCIL